MQGDNTTDKFRIFFSDGGKALSPWHDIPLKAAEPNTYNFVCEIPKETSAKMECATVRCPSTRLRTVLSPC